MSHLSVNTLSGLASIRLSDNPLDKIIQSLVELAKDALNAEAVSTTLVRGDEPWTAAYAGQLAMDADEMQYERGYGPCIDAGVSGTLLLVDDMRTETRWPDYAKAVVSRGVLSSISVPLPLQTEVVGALNCYSTLPSSFSSEEQIQKAVELAQHVAVAVANAVVYTETAQLAEDMRIAMDSRAVIEQAKGVIMAQSRCSSDEAFDVLRRASQGRNVKLRDVASDLISRVSTGGASEQA